MTRLTDLKKQWLKEPGFRAEYERLGPEFELIRELIEARSRAGLTQAQLAERMGTQQAAIARLEGGRVRPSMDTLRRYAKATGSRLHVTLEAGADT